MTARSKESGMNVSYQSNYSNIKSNILRFKNKGAAIKVPIAVQTPSKFNQTHTSKISVPNSVKKSNLKPIARVQPRAPSAIKNQNFPKVVNIELK